MFYFETIGMIGIHMSHFLRECRRLETADIQECTQVVFTFD